MSPLERTRSSLAPMGPSCLQPRPGSASGTWVQNQTMAGSMAESGHVVLTMLLMPPRPSLPECNLYCCSPLHEAAFSQGTRGMRPTPGLLRGARVYLPTGSPWAVMVALGQVKVSPKAPPSPLGCAGQCPFQLYEVLRAAVLASCSPTSIHEAAGAGSVLATVWSVAKVTC